MSVQLIFLLKSYSVTWFQKKKTEIGIKFICLKFLQTRLKYFQILNHEIQKDKNYKTSIHIRNVDCINDKIAGKTSCWFMS